mmetsp:Transcript_2553/g.3755  ORF Transcript_2553/g.3755 Transcript_2553/m.3755 type:complete len:179 (+) Transcript_2553:62-598(+)
MATLVFFLYFLVAGFFSEVSAGDADEIAPWYAREKMEIVGITLPCSPAIFVMTLLILVLGSVLLYLDSGTYDWAQGRHILVPLDPTTTDAEVTKKQQSLLEWKQEIGTDKAKFIEYAQKYCSKIFKNGGNLGKFYKGEMEPSLDRVVFDAKTPIGTTIGPVKTSFGWHLIFIEDRKLS